MTRFARTLIVALAAFAVAVGTLTADAQQRRGGGQRGGPGGPGFGGRGGFPGGGSPVFLLMRSQVADELKLTEEQTEQIRNIMREGMGDRRERRPEGEQPTEEEREKAREEARKRAEGLLKQLKEKVLSAEQGKRLDQVVMWVEGPRVLASDKVVQALGITDTQKGQIDAVLKEMEAKMEAAMQKLRDSRTEGQDFRALFQKGAEFRDQLQKETAKKLMPILSEEQTNTFKQMMGAPFKLESRMPDFRGRGPQGRGQRPQGQDRQGRGDRRPGERQRPQA